MMKNLLPFITLLLSYSSVHSQSFVAGQSDVEYNQVFTPGITLKNKATSIFTSSNLSVFNDANYRLDFGVRSSTFGDGANNSFIQSWYNRPLDFYTGAERRVSIDSMGRVSFIGDDLLQDTIINIRSTVSGSHDVVGISSKIIPNGPDGFWGVGGTFQGGFIGVEGIANTGLAVRGEATSGVGVKGKSGTGTGVHGTSLYGVGILGYSFSNVGIHGSSNDSTGVIGTSTTDHAIVGISSTANKAGVYGYSTDVSGYGVYGVSNITSAVRGEAQGGTGVFGKSIGGDAIIGTSTSGYGMNAQSTNNHGIIASTQNISKYDFKANGPGMDYGAGSSQRWKSNIENIENPLEMIAQLRGVRYDWDMEHGGGRHDIGFIAEEVGKVLPEIVTYEDNGVDAIAMDYTKVSALIVEAFNALKLQYDGKFKKQEHLIEKLNTQLIELKEIAHSTKLYNN